eukprot:TRINITY_DN24184_c0_g1_i1.p1 TRINITY_DN24184_c0_g1~~TRINITY_DN24184_c0_g1_i1.p1  ORF type:complete len:475 (+),score=113.96 TRINITY_DN24184_c0_g1_i1:58-1425(+)
MGGEGPQLYRWPLTGTAEKVMLRAVDSTGIVELAPYVPPLSVGYAPIVVSGGKLVLSLREKGGGGAQASGCVDMEGCNTNTLLHTYQKSFECVNASRGNVELYSYDGKDVQLINDDNGAATATDPIWMHPSPDGTGFFWVGHDTGATTTGVFLSKGTHPMPQFSSQVQQTLYFTSTHGNWTTEALWRTYTPTQISRFETWENTVLFWAYDPAELIETYDDPELAPSNSTCYPPGRIQGIVSTYKGVEYYTKVMTGINVPAYEGCTRRLYSISRRGMNWTVSAIAKGGSQDGLGVPTRQCCEKDIIGAYYDTNETWSGDLKYQAGRTCKVSDNITGCTASAGASVTMPKGCLDCYRNSTEASFVYSNYMPDATRRYSTATAWSTPRSGWWFTGFQSIWKDVSSDVFTGEELYRPGGFAWREHWPRTMGVWTETTVPLRDDCEDCEPGFFGDRKSVV